MSIDNNKYDSFFSSSSDAEQGSFWDSLIGAGGKIIDKLPTAVDGYLKSEAVETEEKKRKLKENITSTNPNVSANANMPIIGGYNSRTLMIAGTAGLIGLVVLVKLLK